MLSSFLRHKYTPLRYTAKHQTGRPLDTTLDTINTMTRELISFDWAIKKILRNKVNFGILEGFLSELLFTNIRIIEILESESNQENKDNRVNIKVIDSKQQNIIIEISTHVKLI